MCEISQCERGTSSQPRGGKRKQTALWLMSLPGTKRTCLPRRVMSAFGGRPDASQMRLLLPLVTQVGRSGTRSLVGQGAQLPRVVGSYFVPQKKGVDRNRRPGERIGMTCQRCARVAGATFWFIRCSPKMMLHAMSNIEWAD